MHTNQVTFRNVYDYAHAHIYVYIHTHTFYVIAFYEKEPMNLKESKNGYMIRFEGRKGKGKRWNYMYYNHKKSKNEKS